MTTTPHDLASAVQGLASDIQDLARTVQAARGIKPTAEQKYCRVCDEPLIGVQHRVGLCWRCQAREERDYEGWV